MGEYRRDSLAVFDHTLKRISVLDADLKYARSLRIPPPEGASVPRPIGSFPNGDWLVSGYANRFDIDIPSGVVRIPEVLLRCDPACGAIQRLGEMLGSEVLIYRTDNSPLPGSRGIPFGRSTAAGTLPEGYYIATNDRYELQFYEDVDRLVRVVRRSGVQRVVTTEHREAIRTRQREWLERAVGNGNPYAIAGTRAALDLPIPDSMPAFGRAPSLSDWPVILADDGGNTWVLEYYFPSVGPQRWDVFESQGAFLGTVLFPDRFSPLDIGEDWVLGVWRDEDDVHHVQVYRLIKP